jgi:hypothetical protein
MFTYASVRLKYNSATNVARALFLFVLAYQVT